MRFLQALQNELTRTGKTILSGKIKAGADSDKIVGALADGRVKINIKAPARANAANQALIRLLGKEFHVQCDQIKIIKGRSSSNKIIKIQKGGGDCA